MSNLVRAALRKIVPNHLKVAKESTKRRINTSSKPSHQHLEPVSFPKTPAVSPAEQNKNWLSWGWSETDEFLDRFCCHMTFFWVVSMCFCLGGTWIAYSPDPGLKEWAQREAYLQLRYREDHGLPPISRNYVDPAKIYLPSDEELGDTDIII